MGLRSKWLETRVHRDQMLLLLLLPRKKAAARPLWEIHADGCIHLLLLKHLLLLLLLLIQESMRRMVQWHEWKLRNGLRLQLLLLHLQRLRGAARLLMLMIRSIIGARSLLIRLGRRRRRGRGG